MQDLIGATIMVAVLPTTVFALLIFLVDLVWSLAKCQKFYWLGVPVALCVALAVQLAFLLMGGMGIGLLFGQFLGYGAPMVILLVTLLVGIGTFVYTFAVFLPKWRNAKETRSNANDAVDRSNEAP